MPPRKKKTDSPSEPAEKPANGASLMELTFNLSIRAATSSWSPSLMWMPSRLRTFFQLFFTQFSALPIILAISTHLLPSCSQ